MCILMESEESENRDSKMRTWLPELLLATMARLAHLM